MPDLNGNTETSPLLEDSNSTSVKPTGAINGHSANSNILDGSHDSTEDPEQQEDAAKDRKAMQDVKLMRILPALAIGVFLAAADQTIIVSTYAKIGSDLNALNSTSWVATAYFLTLTSFQPLYGKLSDIFGRKAALLSAYAFFGIGCLFCGLARNLGELVAARAFAGIGGGGMTTVVSILLSDIVPLRERGVWQGYINIIYSAGSGLGAPLGGVCADYISWRWAFLVQCPMALIAFVAVLFSLHLPKKDSSHWRSKLRRIDFLGAFILVGAVSTLLLALDRGSNDSWSSVVTLVSLGVSLPLFALFIFVEMKIASEPFAPGHLIFSRALFAPYLCNFFSFGGWFAGIFYIPLYYQVVDDLSATQAGALLLPAIVASVSGSLGGGISMRKTGKYYWLTLGAYSAMTLGLIPIILCSGPVTHSIVGITIGMVITGFSNGIGVTTTLIALIANTTPEEQAIATACSYLFRSLGSVTGVSLASTIVQQSLRSNLRASLKSDHDIEKIVKGVRRSLEYIKTLEPAILALVVHCYENAIVWAFVFGAVTVSGAAISAVYLVEKPLSR